MNQSSKLLRRLLRAKDRLDAAPEHDWAVAQLAEISDCQATYERWQAAGVEFNQPPIAR